MKIISLFMLFISVFILSACSNNLGVPKCEDERAQNIIISYYSVPLSKKYPNTEPFDILMTDITEVETSDTARFCKTSLDFIKPDETISFPVIYTIESDGNDWRVSFDLSKAATAEEKRNWLSLDVLIDL